MDGHPHTYYYYNARGELTDIRAFHHEHAAGTTGHVIINGKLYPHTHTDINPDRDTKSDSYPKP